MVAREVRIDQKIFFLKQGKIGCFETINFEVNGREIGSLTIELLLLISQALHQGSKEGSSGRCSWREKDLMFWLNIKKKVNRAGPFMEVTWSKVKRNCRRMFMCIPMGSDSMGWKRFAIGIDSLNPLTRNFSENIFPCAEFAGRSRAFNTKVNGKLTTCIDSLGLSHHFGAWEYGVICSTTSSSPDWAKIGSALTKLRKLKTPFQLLPANEHSAIFFLDSKDCRESLIDLRNFWVNDIEISIIPWSPTALKTPPTSSVNSFWIELIGVPHHCWTLDTIHSLSEQCGELLLIDPLVLSLEDITKIRFKVRNILGLKAIPRLINLSTVDGDFEIIVNVLPVGAISQVASLQRIVIGEALTSEEGDDSVKTLGINAELADTRHPTPLSYRDVLVGNSNTRRKTNLQVDCSDKCVKEKVGHQQNLVPQINFWAPQNHFTWGQRQRRSNPSKRYKWVWLPKKMSGSATTSSCSNFILNPISNSNLGGAFPVSLGTAGLLEGATNTITPFVVPSSPIVEVPLTAQGGSLDTNNNNTLAEKRFNIGLELGLTSNSENYKTLALFQKSIAQDETNAEVANNLVVDTIEDNELEAQDLVSLHEDSQTFTPIHADVSTGTPIHNADGLEWWEDSQVRADFLREDSDFIDIPPGFESSCPPPPGFETARQRRRAIRLSIYNRLASIDPLFPRALSLNREVSCSNV